MPEIGTSTRFVEIFMLPFQQIHVLSIASCKLNIDILSGFKCTRFEYIKLTLWKCIMCMFVCRLLLIEPLKAF